MKSLALKIFFLLSILVLATVAYHTWNFSRSHPEKSAELIIDVPPGGSFNKLFTDLKAQGIEIPRTTFKVWFKLQPSSSQLHPGEFKIDAGWSHRKILNQILAGRPIQRQITVREGDNIYDIERVMAEHFPEWTRDHYQTIIRSAKRLHGLPIPKDLALDFKSLEGFLFPETYSYQKYDSPNSLIDAMIRQFKARALPILRQHEWGKTDEGLFKLLTLASIVEKESGDFKEQPLIASVFWNRIKKGMRLQSDPTTIYALMPEFDGNLKKIHLLTTTPYNTYKINTLPAGPIANPGESALRAVLQPAVTEYLYFVSRGDGTHVFSKDYETHAKYVQEYQIRRRKK